MRKVHLLGLFSLVVLLALVLSGCRGASPTPDTTVSPLQSPVETPVPPAPTLPPISQCPTGCISPTVDCVIKGVVTGMGDRYYYTPDMAGYEDAQVLPPFGGRWFCNEEDAVNNGFQPGPGQ